MSKVLAIQHVNSETIGIIADALKSEGVFTQYILIYEGQPVPKGMDAASGLQRIGKLVFGRWVSLVQRPR